MNAALKEIDGGFPFVWANLNSYRDSEAHRVEIYLSNKKTTCNNLIKLFYALFGLVKSDITLFDESWWDFCLDTWNFDINTHDYTTKHKSPESREYLKMLNDSQIQPNYSGRCVCTNWDRFLTVTLRCIINHKAPYSHLFIDIKNKYFFYFHYTGSIGLYYKENNSVMSYILSEACRDYIVRE